jgi:hypothetical protein
MFVLIFQELSCVVLCCVYVLEHASQELTNTKPYRNNYLVILWPHGETCESNSNNIFIFFSTCKVKSHFLLIFSDILFSRFSIFFFLFYLNIFYLFFLYSSLTFFLNGIEEREKK